MHLVGFVVAGQCVHHDVDPGAECLLALALAARHHGINRAVCIIERPGRGKIVGRDDDRAHTVGALCALDESLTGLDFTKLDHYVGVSAGGFIAASLANGISPNELANAKNAIGSLLSRSRRSNNPRCGPLSGTP